MKSIKKELKPFISTLIATLIGVFMAVALPNSGNLKKEQDDAIKLLVTSKVILDGTHNYVEQLGNYINVLEKDSLKNSDIDIIKIKENNPLPYPDLMETIMSN